MNFNQGVQIIEFSSPFATVNARKSLKLLIICLYRQVFFYHGKIDGLKLKLKLGKLIQKIIVKYTQQLKRKFVNFEFLAAFDEFLM